jgi:hypothetical protein
MRNVVFPALQAALVLAIEQKELKKIQITGELNGGLTWLKFMHFTTNMSPCKCRGSGVLHSTC